MLLGMPCVHQAAGALVLFPRQYLPLARGLGAAASPRRAGLVGFVFLLQAQGLLQHSHLPECGVGEKHFSLNGHNILIQ